MAAINTLTDRGIKAALKAAADTGTKPKPLQDGGGLSLHVQTTGKGWWRLRYWIGGREGLLSLGTYPEVTLQQARGRRDEARRQIADGINPSEARKAGKAEQQRQQQDTEREAAGLPPAGSFEAVALEWLGTVHAGRVSAGHSDRTRIRLEQDIFPWLGRKPLAAITAPMLLECLRRVEARGAIETAHRIKQACGQVFRYGIATGACERNPAADLRDALRPVLVKHHAAITDPQRVGELLRALADYQGHPVTRAALALAPLVFLRPGELRQAEWAEFDLEVGLWTIPPERMKRTVQDKVSGPAHLVPLSRQAVAILRELQPLTAGRSPYVFPSLRTAQRPMSENAVLSALRRMGYPKEEMTGHGFRAMARTMLAERLGVAEAVIEAQLAHSVRDTLGRAYNRTEFMEQRRQMMQTWADYLDRLRAGAEVVPLRGAAA
jgi:integrase